MKRATDLTDSEGKGEGNRKTKQDMETEANNLLIYGRQLQEKLPMGSLNIKVKGDGAKDGFRSCKIQTRASMMTKIKFTSKGHRQPHWME